MSVRYRAVASLLAIALMAATVPFVPTASAAQCQTGSNSSLILDEDGYVAIQQLTSGLPVLDRDRVSQALYFHILQGDTRAEQLLGDTLGISLRQWTNGQDAYVVDFGCETDGNEHYCIKRTLETSESDDETPVFTRQFDETPPDIHVAFYSGGLKHIEDDDPDVPADDEDPYGDGDGRICVTDDDAVPGGQGELNAEYAVIYTEDGHPEGLQTADRLQGPYTESFFFELKRT